MQQYKLSLQYVLCSTAGLIWSGAIGMNALNEIPIRYSCIPTSVATNNILKTSWLVLIYKL